MRIQVINLFDISLSYAKIMECINFIKDRKMKIQKTKQIKWQFEPPEDGRHVVMIKNKVRRNQKKSSSFGNIFGLPESILEQPKLSSIKTMIKAKNNSFKQFLGHTDHQQHKTFFNNSLRNTLTNRVKWLLSPKKRQKLALQANAKSIEVQQEQRQLSKRPKGRGSQKVIDLLQNVILETSFKTKQKTFISFETNKLPTINTKDIKKDKVLAALPQKHSCISSNEINFTHRRVSGCRDNRPKQPYFSAWQVTEASQF